MALKSDEIFAKIQQRIENVDPEKPRTAIGIFHYKITVDGKQVKEWTMDLKNLKFYEGAPKGDAADTTLTVSDEDFFLLGTKKITSEEAIAEGRFKIEGNKELLLTLGERLKTLE